MFSCFQADLGTPLVQTDSTSSAEHVLWCTRQENAKDPRLYSRWYLGITCLILFLHAMWFSEQWANYLLAHRYKGFASGAGAGDCILLLFAVCAYLLLFLSNIHLRSQFIGFGTWHTLCWHLKRAKRQTANSSCICLNYNIRTKHLWHPNYLWSER